MQDNVYSTVWIDGAVRLIDAQRVYVCSNLLVALPTCQATTSWVSQVKMVSVRPETAFDPREGVSSSTRLSC